MSNYAVSLKRTSTLLAALALTASLLVVNFAAFFSRADAATLTTRSLTLNSTRLGNVGGSTTANSELNGVSTTHTVSFEAGTASTLIKSIRLQYCTTAVGTCTAPTGLDAKTGASIVTQTDEGVAFVQTYTIDAASTVSNLILTNATGNTIDTGSSHTIVFAIDSVTNPTTLGTFFIRMSTYTGTNGSTGPVDDGTVASATTDGITITSRVAETLGFSTTANAFTGITDPSTNCTALTSGTSMTLGDPTDNTLALSTTYDNYSAFRIYTNASLGVVVTYEGETLTKSGTEAIDEINSGSGTATTSVPGTEQFGLAVDTLNGHNGSSASNVAIASSATPVALRYANDASGFSANGALTINGEYDHGDGTLTSGGTGEFAFNGGSPVSIASSSSYVECKTAAVRYIANISPLTPAGTYTTTIVYSAVPTY